MKLLEHERQVYERLTKEKTVDSDKLVLMFRYTMETRNMERFPIGFKGLVKNINVLVEGDWYRDYRTGMLAYEWAGKVLANISDYLADDCSVNDIKEALSGAGYVGRNIGKHHEEADGYYTNVHGVMCSYHWTPTWHGVRLIEYDLECEDNFSTILRTRPFKATDTYGILGEA